MIHFFPQSRGATCQVRSRFLSKGKQIFLLQPAIVVAAFGETLNDSAGNHHRPWKTLAHGLWCLWQFSVFGYRSTDLVNMTSQPSPLQSTTLPSWRPVLMNKNKHIKQVLGLYSSWWLNRRVQKLPMVPSCVNISTILVFGVRSLQGTIWVESPRLNKESRTEIYSQCTFLNKNNSNCQFHISKQQTISGNFFVGNEVASNITGSWTNKIYAWPSKMRGPNIWDPPMPA